MSRTSGPSDLSNADRLPGNLLRRERERQFIKQSDMAACLRYSRGYLSAVENNKVPVTPEVVEAYEQALGLAPGSILSAEAEAPPENAPRPNSSRAAGDILQKSLQGLVSNNPFSESYDEDSKVDVYVTGPLADLPPHEQRELLHGVFEIVTRLCDGMGLSCRYPYRAATRPNTAQEVADNWMASYKAVRNADVLVAYVGKPSFSVGAELEMARSADKQIVILCEKNRLDKISRLVLGNPALVATVPFEGPDDLFNRLALALFQIFSRQNLDAFASALPTPMSWTDHARLLQLLDPAELADARAFRGQKFIKPITKAEWKTLADNYQPELLFENHET